ncbi:MAG: DNA polymerase-3 subunit beta [Planctomycetota bacterium]|jgi:DNA polymerase-3 subunit beta
MKVLCDREKLREGLAIVNNVIPTRSPKPVLENVRFVATDSTLELIGTDLEVSVRYVISDVKVAEPGVLVIPARVALDFIRDLTSETVSLHTSDGNCTITGGADSCELVMMDADEYPVTPTFDDKDPMTLQAGTFTRLAGQTAFAAAREAGRYAMHGVLISTENEELKMVATDGRRMALSTAPVEDVPKNPTTSIIPSKGIQLFCRVIDDPLSMIKLSFGENQIGMKTHNAEIFARLIDGDYPQYSDVVPETCKISIEANAELFSRKLRLVANVTGDEARAVRLQINAGELEFFGQSAGRGEAHAHMDIDYSGGLADIAFNPDYVLDGIKNSERETIRLDFNDKSSPGKFSLGENYIYIVMPITTDA